MNLRSRVIFIATFLPKEVVLNAGKPGRGDLLIYVLSGLAAAWAVVCVIGLLLRAK